MNRTYKAISNENTTTTGARILRLSTLCAGLAVASLSMQATAAVITIPGTNPIVADGDVGVITGLTNTNFSTTTTYNGGQAATQEQVSIAAADAKTEVVAGTNVSVTNVPGGSGQNVYTVDADKTTVSTTSPGLTVVSTPNSTTNVTDYAVDLSGATVASLGLANTSIQTVITQVNGTNVKTLNNTNNTANFTNTGSGNIVLSDNGGAINVDTAPTLNLTSVITGGSTLDTNGLVNGNTTLNSSGVSIAGGGPSMTTSGIDAGSQVISNVFSGGSNVNNAANIGDVQAAAAEAKTEVVAGTNVTVTNVPGGSGQNVYTVDADKTTVSTTSPGLTVVSTPNSTTNVTDYAVDLSGATVASLGLANTSIQTVITQVNGTNVKTLNNTNNTANFTNTGSGNIVLSDNGGAINVDTAPTLNLTSVVTGNTTINNSGFVNGNTTITTNGLVNGNTTVNGTGVSIAGGPSMTTGGINAGNQVITGVANGTAPNHAVNFGQLTTLGNQVNDLEDELSGGIASAIAIASMPSAMAPGEGRITGGTGYYNGEAAIALGISGATNSGMLSYKVGGSYTDTGGTAIGGGISYKIW